MWNALLFNPFFLKHGKIHIHTDIIKAMFKNKPNKQKNKGDKSMNGQIVTHLILVETRE